MGNGDDLNIISSAGVTGEQVLKLFSPTDGVRGLLAIYIRFKARECLDQAVLASSLHPVN